MFIRMVHVKVRSGQVRNVETLYQERIIRTLGTIRGCRFAGLLQSAHHPDHCISLTMWDREDDAKAYEGSGVYSELLKETKPYLAESSESTVRMSENLTLEVVQLPEEVVVHSHPVAVTTDTQVESIEGKTDIWVRIVLLKIRPGKREEFKKRYVEKVIPALKSLKGCRHVYLTEQEDEPDLLASVTTWDSKEDEERYEKSGLFEKLIDMQKDLLSSLYEWKRYREERGRPGVATSEDLVVELYNVLTSRSF